MIICICRGANERDVASAIENGASSISDFQRCGIGTECGSCHPTLYAMLLAARAKDTAALVADSMADSVADQHAAL